MSDLESILGLAGVPLMEKEPAGWTPTPEQEKWLGGANRQDPYILWRMPGKKPPISYFTDPEDQELAKAIGYVEKPAPVVDKSIDKRIDPDAPGEDMNTNPDMKPAVKTQARPDDKNKSEPKELPAEPTKSDNDAIRANIANDDEPFDIDSMKIDPDADGEDMNTNPDMTPFVPEPKTETPPQPADTASGSDDTDYGEEPDTGRTVDYDSQGRPDYDELYGLARPDGDSAYGPYDSYDDMMKARANPQASADAQRGANADKMRSTLDMFDKQADADAGLSQQAATNNKIADFDRQFKSDGEDYSLADRARDNNDIAASNAEIAKLNKQLADLAADNKLKPADQVLSPEDEAELAAKYDRDAELQQAMNQDNGLDYAQGSVKDTLNKALAQEPKVDMDKPMPSNIRSGEDLYKALDGNLDWLNKNIK